MSEIDWIAQFTAEMIDANEKIRIGKMTIFESLTKKRILRKFG